MIITAGHIEDFLIDDESWSIRYLVIDTVNFWPSKPVLISPEWVTSINWTDRKIQIDLSEAQIKNSPDFHPEAPVNREYEEQLYHYYGRPKYWSHKSPSGFTASVKSRG